MKVFIQKDVRIHKTCQFEMKHATALSANFVELDSVNIKAICNRWKIRSIR